MRRRVGSSRLFDAYYYRLEQAARFVERLCVQLQGLLGLFVDDTISVSPVNIPPCIAYVWLLIGWVFQP